MSVSDRVESLYRLEGKVACVTGASGGLGRQAATILAAAGVSVVGVARRDDQLQAWADQISGEVATVVADLADRESLDEVVARISEPWPMR